MIFQNTHVYNFKDAFYGMRNPMDSWDRSDSYFGLVDIYNTDALTDVCDAWVDKENEGRRERGAEEYSHDMECYNEYYDILDKYESWLTNQGILNKNEYANVYDVAFLGPNDLDLAQSLILAGNEHAKFMRQIFVSVTLVSPRYFWTEMDTYKVGTTSNSTSTMHKLTSRPIERADFSFDIEDELVVTSGLTPHGGEWEVTNLDYIDDIVDMCENLRLKYLETKDKRYWRALIQMLPQSYRQTRTWTANYAVLRNIYFQRKNHKLKEWREFCQWIENLPWGKELITIGENK